MKRLPRIVAVLVLACVAVALSPSTLRAEVRAWEGTITIPTYPWEEDVNPKFWALETGSKLSTTVKGSIVYPYTMQDHLSRKKVDRTYKALFLENEYLKVTCLPELGGRLHSVLDKTTGQQMFYLNHVIKPGMIAMRGAWTSGGVEWNAGPHGHTVTAVSPVTAALGRDPVLDEAFIEITNLEKIFRTRWTVRVTLRSGCARLDEHIRIENPTDGMNPYYFWNCTAFPNRPGTRFIYPMSLGTDHTARKFFRWPVHEGRDMTWLKNHHTWASVFAVDCRYGFFGAYDVDADRGIVQVANPGTLPGKKAWTWGNWEFGQVAQNNLTDEDGPYIEVQSGPLPTQSDYGMLAPWDWVDWQESWYPVHGLGDGFEYATDCLAVQTVRKDGKLEIRLLGTSSFPKAVCAVTLDRRELLKKEIALSPAAVQTVTLPDDPQKPVRIRVTAAEGGILADYTSPLPIPKTDPPDPATFADKPDDQRTAEELYLKARKFDRATDRRNARAYYEKAVGKDPGHVASLRALAVMDFEAGLYEKAVPRLRSAVERDEEDGLAWYYLGACSLRLGNEQEAIRCGYRAARHKATRSMGCGLAGRAKMRLGDFRGAARAFASDGPPDPVRVEHELISLWRLGFHGRAEARRLMELLGPGTMGPEMMMPGSECRIPHPVYAALHSLDNRAGARGFTDRVRGCLGDADFELAEIGLQLAELGLFCEAERIVRAGCVESVPADQRSPLPIYWLAWFAHKQGKEKEAAHYLELAAKTHKEKEFASRVEGVPVFKYAVEKSPGDAQAHFQLGCLLANLGRVDEAVPCWEKAAELSTPSPPTPLPQAGEGSKKPSPPAALPQTGEGRIASIAWRNLGLAAAAKDNDLAKAAGFYRKAIAARPSDQTLYRDLAEILLAQGKRSEAIKLMETMPIKGVRRAEITVMLAQAYVDEKRWKDCIKLLESTPYFVNWEGQDITWRLFNRAHIERGRQRMDKKDFQAALADFEAALTYPKNLNVGRSDKPEEAPAQYWRGKALAALKRAGEARAAWKAGAEGADVHGVQNEYRQKCRQALSGKE